MIRTFTQTDLIRYLYHEITEEEKSEIDRALVRDSRLKALFNDVCAALKDLDKAVLQPSEATLDKILNYSRTLQTKE
ncbi:MAG: hypothetical protein M3Y60_10215 [Bacteroidota bacterium]|nr:hypothetical protein [Bacteroidota bacterium]